MADGYRLDKEDILSFGLVLIDYVSNKNFDMLYKEAWRFIFEVRVDLHTAIENNDREREVLYTNSISAISNLVENIIQLDDIEKMF